MTPAGATRAPLQALGGAQTVVLGTIYLVLALAALAAIGLFAGSASRENASALRLEKSVAKLHLILRGLNETVVTQGSSASRTLVKDAAASFQRLRAELPPQDAALLAGWDEATARIDKLMGADSNMSFDDDALIALGRITSGIEKHVSALSVRAEAQRAQAGETERRAGLVIIGAAALIFLGTFGIFTAFHRNVTRPVETAIAFADRVAEGDLTASRHGERRGQAGRLLDTLSAMSGNLRAIVTDVRDGTREIDHAAAELARGNEDLAQRTDRQATALEETAASMEELSTAVGANAANARLASEKSAQARATALRGGESVSTFFGKMESIQDGSRRMSEIIGVIDGIAFQTNILALNAAVEAARAGEHGRGFAVVAAEVRALSQRTATAAREIKGLIDRSGVQVAEGGKMVDSSRRIMHEIESSIDEVTRLVQAISQASEEQAAGVRQVSSAIVQMEQTVQENAALVERTSTASQAMKQQAGALAQAVAVFRIDSAHAEARAPGNTGIPPALTKGAPRPARRLASPAAAAATDGEWKEF